MALPPDPASPTQYTLDLNTHAHSVQFYSNDTFLLDALSRFMGSAVGAGDAAIVIATEPHRDELARRLSARGLDLQRAAEQGRYVALDAAETLSQFMVDGWPDEKLFVELLSSVISRARAAAQTEHGRAALFGEMVAVLWAEGKTEAALRLEQLWNQIAQSHSFSLVCAYPLSMFYREDDSDAFLKICSEHSAVIPAESYTLASEAERLRAIALWQQKAQALEAEVAQRKRAEQRLARREAELRDFFENCLVPMHWVGADGTILWANRAEMDLLGYGPDECLGRNIAEFHADRAAIHDILQRLTRAESVYDYEARLRCKDGSLRDVVISSNALWEDGKFVHTRCVTHDITDKKKAEEALARVAAIVETSDDAIVSKDLNGIITTWNKGAERLFGYTAQEAIGQPVTMLIPPDRLDEERQILQRIRGGGTIDHYETVRRRKDGTLVDISLTVSPVKDGQGRIVGASKIARDITDRKRAEAAIREQQALLRKSEQLAAAGQLAASMAHEINNPLSSVTNALYLIETHPSLDASVRSFATTASTELARVSRIVKQSLSYYQAAKAPASLDLGSLIEESLEIFGDRCERARIHLSKRIPKGTSVLGFSDELRQVIDNLLLNAVEAMPEGGRLSVRVQESCDWKHLDRQGVRVTIADSGCGIPKDVLPKIFEPFLSTKSEKGAGLGLWVVQGIIAKHEGSISVRSSDTQGKSGTVVSIFLPSVARAASTTAAQSESAA